eukprot:5757542-Pleurochrysis_carterae.AAC.1
MRYPGGAMARSRVHGEPPRAMAASLQDLLEQVQSGSGSVAILEEALAEHATGFLQKLQHPPRSATQLDTAVRDNPDFVHCGQKLTPRSRDLVIRLSEQLNVSELRCFDLLL